MKKIYYVLAIVAVPALLVLYGYSSGYTPGGKSGSPGDGGNTCTDCHSGTAMPQEGWITTDMVNGEWIPGHTYTITATGTHENVMRFGFELTAENALGQKVGMFTITNTTETQLTMPQTSVTHTSQGNTPSGDMKTWSMDWTAPDGEEGEITFYAAFNAANGNGNTSGDVIYTSMLKAQQSSIGIDDPELQASVSLYPNPATDYAYLKIPEELINAEVHMLNQSGQLVGMFRVEQQNHQIDLSDYSTGIYYISLLNKNHRIVKKLIKR